jgi:hypothetical protein|tara:strand:- start:7211 stop:7753 length:543 start_codon:yes stop_codon:yes gene_type:complete
MQINFTTENIDKKLYTQLILYYIYEHYSYKDYTRLREQDKWKITIKRTQDFDKGFYQGAAKQEQLDYSIPHGVTGLGDITCYISDNKNNIYTMQNMSVICHELAHMILMIYYPNEITKQRHDDFYGKVGTDRKLFSSEVHDRITEGKTKIFKRKVSRFKSISFIGVDISDITNSRKRFDL